MIDCSAVGKFGRSRLAHNQEIGGPNPSGAFARVARPCFNHGYHPHPMGSPRNHEAAASLTFLMHYGFDTPPPLAAATIYSEVRRAIRQNLCHLFLRKRGDDGELVFPCEKYLIPLPPILSRFASSPSHNHFQKVL